MRKKEYLFIILNMWRLWIIYIIYNFSKNKKEIDMDIKAWNKVKGLQEKLSVCLAEYLLTYKEFRNLFLYRVGMQNNIILKLLFPPLNSLYLACPKIGGGLFIQHGFSTILAAKEVGNNCWINQQVTVGYKADKAPIIGDNVKIYCGAIVIGDVNIGDNVIIGAGAVVTKSVDVGKTMIGNPAYEYLKNK